MTIDRAGVAGLGVVALWASAFPAIQLAVPQLGVVGLSVVRLLVAAVALVAVAVTRRVRLPRRQDLGWVIASGFCGMTAYQLLLNASELYVPAGTASIVVAAAPLVSIWVAWPLLGEPVTRTALLGGAVALGGVAVVCLARSGLTVSGAVWTTVGAMVVQGVYHPLQRPLLRHRTSLEVVTYVMVAGTLMTLPLVPFGWDRLITAPPAAWAGAVYLGLLPSALGFVLWGFAVGRLSIAASTSMLYLVPPVAVLLGWALLGDRPLTAELLGGAAVLAGVGIVARGPRRAAAGVREQPTPIDGPSAPADGSKPRAELPH